MIPWNLDKKSVSVFWFLESKKTVIILSLLFIACYGRAFGPKGFGYGIGMTLEGSTVS